MSPGRVDLMHGNLLLAHGSSEYSPSRAGGPGFGPPSGPHSCRSTLIDAKWILPGGAADGSATVLV